MTSPTPDDAVEIARTNAAAGRGISVAINIAVLAAIDADRQRITQLEAAIANNEQYSVGYQAGHALGVAETEATHAANPPLPATAPPRQAPTRSMLALQRIKDTVLPRAFRTRLETDKPGEPATGPRVVRVDWVRAAVNPQQNTEPAPPAPAR